MSSISLLSIVISSYNYARFLHAAIDSALMQTYPAREVIVVDDGSTDNSQEIIAKYANRIIPIFKENGGQASAFNAGFRASQGDIIYFLDSDDVLLPTASERIMSLFCEKDFAKVHWPLWVVDEQEKKGGKIVPEQPLPEGNLQEAVLQSGPAGYLWPPTSGNAWSRKFLEAVLPIPEDEYKVSPDLYLSALAPIYGAIGAIQEPQGFWRMHGANNSWRETFDQWLKEEVNRWDHCFRTLYNHSQRLGLEASLEHWRQSSWPHRLNAAMQDVTALVPSGSTFILVDEDQWRTGGTMASCKVLPFLERNGRYWGLPADDETAVSEFDRLRQQGAEFIVFGWPAFWWLDYYRGLHSHLCNHFRCVLENERVVVFDLRSAL